MPIKAYSKKNFVPVKGEKLGKLSSLPIIIVGLFVIVGLLFLAVPRAQTSQGELTDVLQIPFSSRVAATTSHTTRFTTHSPVPADGKISIVFPAGFDLSAVLFDAWEGFDGAQSLSVNGQTVTITRSGGTIADVGSKYIRLSNIVNISTPGNGYKVTVKTEQGDGTIIETGLSKDFYIGGGEPISSPWDWPTHGRNYQRTGRTDASGPVYPTLKWRTSIPDIRIGSSIGKDGIIYVTANRETEPQKYKLYAVNPDGTIKWNATIPKADYPTEGYVEDAWGYSFPEIDPDGFIYVANQQPDTYFTKVNPDTGEIVWQTAPPQINCWGVLGSMVLLHDPWPSRQLNALKLDTGAVKWQRNIGYNSRGYTAGVTSVSLGLDGTIYVTEKEEDDGSGYLHAYNPDGSLKWEILFSDGGASGFYNTQSVGPDGTIYSPRYNPATYDGVLYALNPDGTIKWTFDIGAKTRTTPTIDDNGLIYLGDYDGILHALRDDGTQATELWTYDAGAPFSGYPGHNGVLLTGNGLIVGQVVLTGQPESQRIFALDKSGNFKWSYQANKGDRSYMPVLDKEGTLYFLEEDSLTAFRLWTLSVETDASVYKPGDSMIITVASSMLKKDPLSSSDNQVQAVMPTGEKIILSYSGTNGEGNSIWTGTYTVPLEAIPGDYTATVEAIAYKVQTDTPTNFDSLPSDFNNTGISVTFPYTIVPLNQSPEARNLSVDAPNPTDYCCSAFPPVRMRWEFFDPDEGDSQSAFQIQISTVSDFSTIEVDTEKIASSSEQYVFAEPGKRLSFNQIYYWRLKVWDTNDASSDWTYGDSFTTPLHAYPFPEFSWNPSSPQMGQVIQLCSTYEEGVCATDESICYDVNQNPVSCSGGTFLWTIPSDAVFTDGTDQNSENPRIILFSSDITLEITDVDGYGSCSVTHTINTALPIPVWKEIGSF